MIFLSDSCSRQIRAWADSLQNPDIKSQRHLNDTELAEIKRVLRTGNPIAAGSGHSRLLVGYKDDATKPGGGTFITKDSALNRFDEVTYEFVRKDVCDVFWVENVALAK